MERSGAERNPCLEKMEAEKLNFTLLYVEIVLAKEVLTKM